jgi:uncharacterized protein
MDLAKKIVVFSVLAYAALCLLMFVLQRRLVFPAPRELIGPIASFARTDVTNGTFYLSPTLTSEHQVVVYFHGNGSQVADEQPLAQYFSQFGVSLVAVEYPGYPGAPGEASEAALYAAAEAALRSLASQYQISKQRLVLMGTSLGTGVAVEMAKRGFGNKLILLAAYASLPDVAVSHYPFLPTRLLLRDRFDSVSKASLVSIPVLQIHGTLDAVIPMESGRKLSERFPDGTLTQVIGAGHNDLWNFSATREAVEQFLQLTKTTALEPPASSAR